jgi:tetratricopeptide (TPR) repeat protein
MRHIACTSLLAALGLLWCFPGGAAAEDQSSDRPANVRADTSGYDARITTVRQLLRSRNTEGAIALLELMYETSPTDQLVINLLRNTFEDSRNFAKAELLARRLVERDSGNYGWRIYLAESLAKQGQIGPAEQSYQAAFALTLPADSGRMYGLLNSMMAYGGHDGALRIIDTVRGRSTNKKVFGLQRGMILQMDRRYAESARELFDVLSEDTTYSAGDAERQLLSMLEYPEASPDVEQVLTSVTGNVNSMRGLKLLMSHAIKAGEYDAAFGYAIRQDSIQKGQGLPIFDFARQCFDRKAYGAAVRGAEYALARYQSGPFLAEISFRQAEALAKLGRPEEALVAYQNIAAKLPTPADRSDAYCGMGELYLDQINDPRKAAIYFDTVITQTSRGMSYLKAIRLTPLCYMRLGDYAATAARLEAIIAQQFSEDIMEEAKYRLCLLKLFAHQYDSTKASLKKLMVDYPRGMYVNDAMQMVLDLDQALPDTVLLVMYAGAVEFETRRMPDSARQALGGLADAPDQKLADVALYRLAVLEVSQSDTTAALTALDHLTTAFPESFYRPYGLKLKADLIVNRSGEREQARQIYRELLEKYPNSPFISDARKRLRALEEESRVG